MLIKFFVSTLPLLLYLFFKTKKSFHVLQQNWYNLGNRYIKWIINNPSKVFWNIDLCFLLFFVFFVVDSLLAMVVFIIFYTVNSLLLLRNQKREVTKKPLAITSRIKRLFVTEYILYLIPIILFGIAFDEHMLAVCYLTLGLLIYMNPIVTVVANTINMPIEAMIKKGFENKAKKKLKSMSNLKVIGITGSYGKTSSKNILSDILNIKYNALPTPKNFNTPVGLTITINNYLDKFTDLFIAEMGAFKRGEIKELCDYVHPTYGILTKIGTAHLESFGSQENIQKGKFELIESLPSDGIGILNGDDPLQRSYPLKNNCQIKWIGIESDDVDVKAENIQITATGTTFDVSFKGDKKKYSFQTKLFGKANVYNILAALALGYELGMEVGELQAGVKRVNSIEHRLEMRKYYNINLIDDAYNSNPVGAKMALDVLAMMPGKKIIVTPGMIELGPEQERLNQVFGEQIADVCDEVILVGEEQTKAIAEGLKKKKYSNKNIHILNDVMKAFPLVQSLDEGSTYLLLENDLPDIFNEK